MVNYLRKRLVYLESRRVGEWMLLEIKRKQSELSTGADAFLLSTTGFTINALGDHRKAIGYYQQTLTIDRAVFGEPHTYVAIRLNNLGIAYFDLGQRETALGYFEKAYAIFKKFLGDGHPHTRAVAKALAICSRAKNTKVSSWLLEKLKKLF